MKHDLDNATANNYLKRSFGQRLVDRTKRVVSLIDIEPSLLVHMVGTYMGDLLQTNLMLYKACHINLHYTQDLCVSLVDKSNQNLTSYEEEVQIVTERIGVWSSVIDNFFPVLFVLFLGAWSDVYGRKFPYLLSILGYIIRYVGLILAVYFENWNAETTAVIAALPVAVTGSRIAISMVMYSYVTDTTSIVDRTFKMGMATAVRSLGKSVGSALGGHLNTAGFSYYSIFAFAGGLDCIGFLYVLTCLRNVKNSNVDSNNSTCVKLGHIFNLNSIKDTIVTFFRKRDRSERLMLFLLVVALMGAMIPMQAEDSLLYQYTRIKEGLGWNAGQFGSYNTYRMIIAFIGYSSSVGILSRVLKLPDSVIGIISSVSPIASSFVYAYATSNFMMYLAPLIDILNGTMIIASRSMISKIVPRNEIGKVNSFVAIIDSLVPLPAMPAYNALYQSTLDTFPGAIFLLSASLTISPLVIFSFLGCFMKVNDNNIVPKPGNSSESSLDEGEGIP